MKKLANLIALFILVSVNVITPITYAQEYSDDGDGEQGYNCEFISDSGDRSEGDGYYYCVPNDGDSDSCYYDGGEYGSCETDGKQLNMCYPTYGDDEYPYFKCHIGYEKTTTEDGYSFKESWSGEYSCVCDGGGCYEGDEGDDDGIGDIRSVNNRYGDYACYYYGEMYEEYLGCAENEDGDGYICPYTTKYECNETNGAYSCEENPYGYYYCDSGMLSSLGRGYCWSNYYERNIYNCSADEDNSGYNCPIVYSCSKGDQGIVCSEPESYNYNRDDYFYCKSNGEGKKLSLEGMGDSYCYQPEGNVHYEACDYDSNSGNYICEIQTAYSCTFDGKDGYECTEDEEGVYQCVYPDSLMESSVYDNVVCYYDDIYHGDCSSIDDGYFCPVKWGTTFDNDGEYECLAEGAEFREDLGQCVYTVPGYDGNDIIIMSSNLGVTGGNLTGLYYQWGTGYGFPGYNGDIDDNRIHAPLDGIDRTTFNDYDVDEILWPSDTDPCPTKFHLPSTTEWNNLLISWCEDTAECDAAELTKHYSLSNHWALSDVRFEGSFEDEVYSFMDDLNFPLGGSRDADYVNMLGFMGDYWAKEFYGTGNSRGFTVYPEGGLGAVPFISNHGVQVRCFADVEEGVEVSTPVALDLYIGGCAQQDVFTATSAIEVLEDTMLCINDGYRGRKFVPAGEEVNLDDLDGFLPTGYQWVWYLDDNKENKLEENTTFTNDTRLYAFEEITPITLTVTKVRNDANNQDGIRPESVTVYLYEDNGGDMVLASREKIKTVTLSSANGWTATVGNLIPSHNIDYVWEEEAVSGYESTQNTNGFITTLTNTHTPAVVTKYTVTFNSNGGSTINPVEVVEGQPVTKPTDPKRNGYSFGGWYTDPELTNEYKFTEPVIGPLTLHAKWTENKPSGGNSGGYSGGGSPSKPSSKGSGPSSTEVESKGDGPDTPAKEGTKTEPKPVVVGKADNYTGKVNPNQELFDAYEWAYANGLTKYGNMSDARMNDILNRQEMAKITTIFASKFKNNTPNEDKRDFCSQYPDLWKTTEDMQEYIIQSCELGYMGYRANGIDALDRFRPYTPVSIAEVSIILSRIMWQNKYAINENLRYQGHLHAVYENNLLDNISKPFDYILRKDAYIMLYRISKTL